MAKNKIQCSFGWECNNACLYCATYGESCNNALSLEDIPKILEKISNTEDAEVEISGGEPTLKPEMFYFLKQLSTTLPNIEYVLLTNGRNFSKPALASKMSELTPNKIVVPIHADTPKLHDFITQSQGSFNETMLGIKNLYEYNLPVNLKTVINKLNYERLPQMIEMLAQKFPTCSGIITNMVILNSGKALENKNLIGVRFKSTTPYLENAIDIGKRYGFKVWIYSAPPCLLSEKYRNYLGTRFHPSLIRKNDEGEITRVKTRNQTAEKCKFCRYVAVCADAWGDYFEMYGTDEVQPIN